MFDGRDKWVQCCAERLNSMFEFSPSFSSENAAENKVYFDFSAFIIAGSPDLAPKLFKSKDLKKGIRDRVIEHKLAINANNDVVRGFNEAVMKSRRILEGFKLKQDLKAMKEFMSVHEDRPNSVSIGFQETLFCVEMQIVKKVLYSNLQRFPFCVHRRGSKGQIHREFVRNLPDEKANEKVENTKSFLRRMCAENGIEFVVVDIEEEILSQCVGVLHDGIDLSLYQQGQEEEVKGVPETIWTKRDQRRLERALDHQRQLKRTDRSWEDVAEMVHGKSAQECKERFRQIQEALLKPEDAD